MSCASNDAPFDILARDIQYEDLNLREIRTLVFHLLYALESFEYDASLDAIIENFNRGFELAIPQEGAIATTVAAIIANRANLDEQIKPLLHNWRFERLGICTKIILRYALWELQQKIYPPAVIMNEAIELAKCFSEKDAYKFINGILDEAVKKLGLSPAESQTSSAQPE